jgi:hypothetical protein
MKNFETAQSQRKASTRLDKLIRSICQKVGQDRGPAHDKTAWTETVRRKDSTRPAQGQLRQCATKSNDSVLSVQTARNLGGQRAIESIDSLLSTQAVRNLFIWSGSAQSEQRSSIISLGGAQARHLVI